MNKQKELIAHYNLKQQELTTIAHQLKQDFVGLDEIIDQVIESIKIWYIFPELQIRPTIVCLWGLTGVGKTDLVRKMVSYMKIQDRFLEIEMSEGTKGNFTLQQKLENSSLSPDDHCLLFLDEFQRFRTLNEVGGSISNTEYNDVWTLLSDGKFQADLSRKTELMDELLYSRYYSDYSSCMEKSKSKEPETLEEKKEIKKERLYSTPVYLARKVKRLFKLEEPLEEIMKWNDTKIYSLYENLSTDTQLYESQPYKKMLIVISGNLDEAYRIANAVSDADIDADYYHNYSKKLTVIDIKNALSHRFRPEQIARLGNSHILYPSLSKDNYYKIIILKCDQINKLISDSKGISITYDQSVYDVMYSNGVFPTQGVRPLLSTVTNILSSGIPIFIFQCLMNNVDNITVSVKKNIMFTTISGKVYEVVIPTMLDKIRSKVNADTKYASAVHELGHALVYSILFNALPKQMCIDTTNALVSGFVIPNSILGNKDSLLKNIQVFMAGRAAEEIVFGSQLISMGAQKDIEMATTHAWAYVATLGFDGFVGRMTQKQDDCFIYNTSDVGVICEKMIQEAKQKATDVINSNISLFRAILTRLLKDNKISEEELVSIFKSHKITILKVGENNTLTVGYEELTKKFLEDGDSHSPIYVPVVNITPVQTKEKEYEKST